MDRISINYKVIELEKRIIALEKLLAKKPNKKAKTDQKFNWVALYNEYPARNGAQNYVSAYSHLPKIVRTSEEYDQMMLAIKNYRSAMEKYGKVGSEYIQSFKSFVSGGYTEWTDLAMKPDIKPMSDEELYGV